MKNRCYNLNNSDYADYGGRGITVCKEWLDDFVNFYNWAIANGYNDNLTIDRIDVNGKYEPSNCRWATDLEQARNKRNSIKCILNGEEKTVRELSEEYGVNYRTLHSRIKRGVPVEKAIRRDKCIQKTAKIDLQTGEIIKIYSSPKEAAKENGLKTPNGISRCCIGNGFSCGGFGWEYVKEDIESMGLRYKERKSIFLTKICLDGRISIPKQIREQLEIDAETQMEIVVKDGGIFIKKKE